MTSPGGHKPTWNDADPCAAWGTCRKVSPSAVPCSPSFVRTLPYFGESPFASVQVLQRRARRSGCRARNIHQPRRLRPAFMAIDRPPGKGCVAAGSQGHESIQGFPEETHSENAEAVLHVLASRALQGVASKLAAPPCFFREGNRRQALGPWRVRLVVGFFAIHGTRSEWSVTAGRYWAGAAVVGL